MLGNPGQLVAGGGDCCVDEDRLNELLQYKAAVSWPASVQSLEDETIVLSNGWKF